VVRLAHLLPPDRPTQILLLLRDGTVPGLTATRHRAGVHEVLQIRGLVTEDELRAVYQRSHAAVFPYRFVRTGLPLVLLEAVAAGLPVVTTRVHPIRELEGRTDRKSTRLNSSHLGISYAVFCLKKKTYSSAARASRSLWGPRAAREPVFVERAGHQRGRRLSWGLDHFRSAHAVRQPGFRLPAALYPAVAHSPCHCVRQLFFFHWDGAPRNVHSFPTRRSSD